jgi:hypothetical protein
MSLSQRTFDAIAQFPLWLESFDALQIPGWSVLLAMGVGAIGLVFAIREFLSWFLKTNAIIDEVVRLETMVRDLHGDLSALESVVERLQTTAGLPITPSVTPTVSRDSQATSQAKRLFPLDN